MALPMRALQQHSFLETRTSKSGAILPSACYAALHQSYALRQMIPHHRVTELAKCTICGFSWLLPLGMTTACLVKSGTQNTLAMFSFFFSHSIKLKHKSCIYRHLIPIRSQKVNTDLSHIFSPLSGPFLCIKMRLGWICTAICYRFNEISSAECQYQCPTMPAWGPEITLYL